MSMTVYIRKTCKTCQKFLRAVQDRAPGLKVIDFIRDPVITEDQLKAWLDRAGLRPHQVLRKRDPMYRQLGLDRKRPPDGELIRLMVQHPGLIQRPIVVTAAGVWFNPSPGDVEPALQR